MHIGSTASAKKAWLEGEQLEQQIIVNELLSGGTYIDPRRVVGVTVGGMKVVDGDYYEQLLKRHSHGVNVLRGRKDLTVDFKAKMLLDAAERGSVEAVLKLIQEGVPVGGTH
jgi:hypothetical protein